MSVWSDRCSPFGGYKQSGTGRETGVAGFEEYLETKPVTEPARPPGRLTCEGNRY